MPRPLPIVLLFLVVLPACRVVHKDGPARAERRDAARTSAALPASMSEEHGQVGTATASAPRQRHPGSEALAVWRDPEFQRRFAEGYAAESEIEPRLTSVERDQLQRVLGMLAAERFEEASELLERLRASGGSAAFDYTLGNLLFQSDQLEPAGACYAAAVAKFPRFRRAWRNLGLVHTRLGDFEGAAGAFARVIELGGADGSTYGLLGHAHSSLGNHLAAESAFRIAMLFEPGSQDWSLGLARSLSRQERHGEVASLLGSLIQAQPERIDLWLLQAGAFLGMGEAMRAAQNFEIARQFGDIGVEPLVTLADIYVNEGLLDVAVETHLEALSSSGGGTAQRALRAARVLVARGALFEAERIVRVLDDEHRMRLRTDDRKEILRIGARIAVARGSTGEEARLLEEIVELDPLDGEALLLLGQHRARLGDNEAAVLYYERAAALENYEADARVRHAQLLVGEGRHAEALPLLRRAQSLRPRDNVQQFLEQIERLSQGR